MALPLGLLAAFAASALYNVAVVLQAAEARVVPAGDGPRLSLAGRLLRRPRWLAATGLSILGWPLQTLALVLAPLTVVQPALAFGLIILLVAAARMLGEPVGRREALSVTGIAVGVAVLTLAAPERSTHHASAPTLVAVLVALGALSVAPYALRRGWAPGSVALALAAGLAFAWSGLSTKFVADAAGQGRWSIALAWTAATGCASGLAVLSEMAALQRRAATAVAPLVFVVQVVVPVLAAPLLTGERWSGTPLGGGLLLAGLLCVVVAAAQLVRSPALGALGAATGAPPVMSPSDPSPSRWGVSPVANHATAERSAGAEPVGSSTTTSSPAVSDGASDAGRAEASIVTAPATGDASSTRASRY